MKRRFMVFVVALSMVILLSPCTPQAASPTESSKADFYKDKIVTIVCTAAPGTVNDFYSRLAADYLSKLTGAKIAVENKTAAGGLVARNNFFKVDKPDGLTIMQESTGRLWPGWLTGAEEGVNYDIAKFEYMSGIKGGPFSLGINPKGSYGTIELLKKGKNLRVPSSNATSILSLAAIGVAEALSLDAKLVVGIGNDPAYLSLQQGEAQFMVRNYDNMIGYIKQGVIKPLAQLSEKRDPLLPDVPTIYEVAKLSDTQKRLIAVISPEARIWMLPPGTPKDRVKFWDDALTKMLNDSDFQKKVAGFTGVWFGAYSASEANKELAHLMKERKDFELYKPLMTKYVQ
jgi:tripartite-type tricarboxylate transporter receptor subunit TctC